MKRVAISTLGCKVNSFESELIMQRLVEHDFQRVAPTDVADYYIINSCTVTAEADRQSRQVARKHKRQNPLATVVMTGCYAQNNADTVNEISEVDWVIGNAAKLDIPNIIINDSDSTAPSKQIVHPQFSDVQAVPEDLLGGFESQSRAFIQVQQGCDQGCTFCVIHIARGPSVSFPVSRVLAQYRKIVAQGYKEVVVCGVDLGSYGDDLNSGADLVSLLREMLALELDCRIRLSSIDPYHLSDALITLMAESDSICPHIHLSMQSANTLILKRMKRRASRELIFDRVAALRDAKPGLVLSADVLVGFPTETETQFADTLDAIETLGIAYPHVFPYSNRAGAPAARIPNQVDKTEIKRRAKLARALGQRVWQKQALSRVSSYQRTIIETIDGENINARCDDYFPVSFSRPKVSVEKGDWCELKINGVKGQSLLGEMLAAA